MKVRYLLGVALLLASAIVLGIGYYKGVDRLKEYAAHVATSVRAHLPWGRPTVRNVESFTLEDKAERDALPEYQDIPAASPSELTPALPSSERYDEWTRSQGDSADTRYSSLTQINRANVARLAVAWTYQSKDGKGGIEATPVIANGTMFAPTAGDYIVAIDAQTGVERWRFKPGGRPAMRGLVYWAGNGNLGPRLFFTAGQYLFALDPKTGEPVAGFGRDGKVASGGVVAPAIYQDVIVVANWNVALGYDIATGRQLWNFLIYGKQQGGAENDDTGGNVWGGMAMDAQRGIAYLSSGSPHPNFLGYDHPGPDEHCNSVVALEAKTGRLLWSFQEIRHDIWDLDLPAPPNLVTVVHDGKRVDAVAEVTKTGNTLLLDRVTGKSLFPYRMRRAPVSKLAGERTAPYQPLFTLPERFSRQDFSEGDITDISPAAHEFAARQIANTNHGWFEPFEPGKGTVYYGVEGGAEWTGAAFDPSSGRIYVSASELAWIMTVARIRVGATRDPKLGPTPGEKVYRETCAGCHGLDRKGKGVAPSLIALDNRMLDDEVVSILREGRNAMPPMPVSPERREQLINFLFGRDIPADPPGAAANAHYTYVTKGYPKLLDDQGYPGTKPPWGTLTAIDLNTGRRVWQVALGEFEELTKRGIPKTGTENFGGATVTAGGLVFCAGTRDLKIRAFDKDTGEELWSSKLPFGGFAPPATYQVNGRQYVVVAATGGGKLGGVRGDAYVAFALPESTKK